MLNVNGLYQLINKYIYTHLSNKRKQKQLFTQNNHTTQTTLNIPKIYTQ